MARIVNILSGTFWLLCFGALAFALTIGEPSQSFGAMLDGIHLEDSLLADLIGTGNAGAIDQVAAQLKTLTTDAAVTGTVTELKQLQELNAMLGAPSAKGDPALLAQAHKLIEPLKALFALTGRGEGEAANALTDLDAMIAAELN